MAIVVPYYPCDCGTCSFDGWTHAEGEKRLRARQGLVSLNWMIVNEAKLAGCDERPVPSLPTSKNLTMFDGSARSETTEKHTAPRKGERSDVQNDLQSVALLSLLLSRKHSPPLS